MEMLSGRKKKDYAAESSADAIEATVVADGVAETAESAEADAPAVPADEPIPEELAA